jgi:hypothetical protein
MAQLNGGYSVAFQTISMTILVETLDITQRLTSQQGSTKLEEDRLVAHGLRCALIAQHLYLLDERPAIVFSIVSSTHFL